MSFLILGNILDFPSVIYFQVNFYSNEDIFVCCLLMSNTSFESIIKLICKKKKSHSGQLWLFVKLNEHQIQKLVYIMHILFHNNTIFNNWFFFMFSVAFFTQIPWYCTTSLSYFEQKYPTCWHTSFQTRLVAQIESFLFELAQTHLWRGSTCITYCFGYS